MLAVLLALAHGGDTVAHYWQQHVAYVISAALDEPSGVLTGHVRISYVNRSPDTLHDCFVHQYLNAFRPGSRWAAADSVEGRVRFQHLADPDYAVERITRATVMGRAIGPDSPYAADSTVAHWTLPRPLAPGDSMTVGIEWRARRSTVPRRQGRAGRAGRRFDFAQWYPKVVVYDRHGWEDHPLYPAGEFYGEFASYDVTLVLPADQVVGATGVPVEGDPGWERAKADSALAIDYQRDWYHAPRTTHGCGEVVAGRKCVRFYAEQVHHFAFSLNPQYVYEQGRYGGVVVRVLYLPGDSATWGRGLALGRTITALAWLDSLYGTFAWPQLTNLHRIDRGSTEFPMVVMDASAGQGLILHEVGHNYTMGMLANNEWREVFLDLERWSEPVSMVSERYRDFETYGQMVYAKAQLFYEQLRYVVGDAAMRRILRTYYARWKLKHVDESAFRAVCEEVSKQDLGWLFGQWLHATPLIDYRLRRVERRRLADGQWLTAVTIERRGDGWMPVEIGGRDTIYARATGQPEVERVEFTSAREPARLMLDPRGRAHDYDMLNNREERWGVGRGAWEFRIDDPTRETARRDRLVRAWMPVAWYNDAGGVTLGLRERSNYLGAYNRGLLFGTVATRPAATARFGGYLRFADPIGHLTPRTQTSVAAWAIEGRAGAAFSIDRSLRRHLASRADPHVGFDALWMATTNLTYLDRRLWDDAGTLEAGPWVATTLARGAAVLRLRLGARGGLVYSNPGIGVVTSTRYDVEGFGRFTGEASVRAPFWLGTTLGVRLFSGGYAGRSIPVRQRRIPIAGADPYETFTNPLLRSRGALFVRPDVQYHAPGNANQRGFRSNLAGRWAGALNVELTRSVFRREAGILREAAVEVFADGGVVDPLAVPASPRGRGYATLCDGGVGLGVRPRGRARGWAVRLGGPRARKRWERAADFRPGEGKLALRWHFSLEPSF